MPRKNDLAVPDVTRDYWIFVMVTLPEVHDPGVFDVHRCDLHDRMCEHYGLQANETTDLVGGLAGMTANELHQSLCDLRDRLERQRNREARR